MKAKLTVSVDGNVREVSPVFSYAYAAALASAKENPNSQVKLQATAEGVTNNLATWTQGARTL